MHTTMVPVQLKTLKIQVGVQVSRPGELRSHLQHWKRLGCHFIMLYLLLDRNIESPIKDTSSRSGNDAHADDANIRPIYDEEPMAEVQTTAEINIFATRQQHIEQPEFNNEGEVDQNAEQCHDTCPLPAKLNDNYITEHSYQFLESENICLKKTVAQFQKDFSRMEAHCVNLELKYQNQVLKEGQHGQFLEVQGNSVNTKFAKSSILGKPVLQSLRNKSVVRQPTAFKSERPRTSKPRFASQVDVNNDLSKPVNTHYLPMKRESAVVKPHHVIASSESRNSLKNMPRFSSNDMVHNHYLEEAKKKTKARGRNSRPSVMPSARSQSTANINSRAKVPSNKTTNRNKPIEQISVAKKPERQIPKGHRFSIKKTSVVHEKTMTPRSCLRWKPTGKIFKTVGLRWVPTGKIFTSSTTKVDSEPTNGSNEDITNQYECEQTLNGFKEFKSDKQAMTSDHNSSELGIHDHSNEPSSSKLVPKVVPPADKTATSRQELELLFHHHITMLSEDGNPPLLEPTSNKLLVGDLRILYESNLCQLERNDGAILCESKLSFSKNEYERLIQISVTI
ncbi:hypothetical protein Tco_0922527 [Tanacetum coccineum]|uniref:Uncharacterized protein n=1 Tax=Tanacetum coccineum TaxID=301880 RepID=A0ABQ5CZA4_9ASTR